MEHQIHRQLKAILPGRTFIAVAVSGGLDSSYLLHAVAQLGPLMKVPIYALHVHHGAGDKVWASVYRGKAQAFVKKLARDLGVEFLSRQAPKNLKLRSEAELRDFRYQCLEKMLARIEKSEGGGGLLLLAHHWDDLLETRFIRLMRGTGPQGILAMPLVREDMVVRPLLPFSKSEIENEMKELGLPFLEDPSNQEDQALRNWLRLELFPMIEKRRQGSLRRLALSLENLAEAFQVSNLGDQDSSEPRTEVLDRQALAQMSPARRRAVLARVLRSFQVKNHSTAHLNELAKRLSPSSRGKKFHLLTLVWRLNAQQIRVSRE